MIGDVFGSTPVAVATEPSCPRSTPWGRAQTTIKIADGIYRVDTAGHGGYWLDRKRNASIRARIPSFTTFAGGPWYEEDLDWAIVVAAFPDAFSADHREHAVQTIKSYCGDYFLHAQALVAGGAA